MQTDRKQIVRKNRTYSKTRTCSKNRIHNKIPKDEIIIPEPVKIFNPFVAVVEKYCAAGWTVIHPPKGTINDLITQKDKKFHFIQVITPATYEGARFHGIPKNTFIQNAFSNGAIPVYAHVVHTEITTKITFEDINQNNRIIIK